MYSPIWRHIQKKKNTSAFNTWSSSGVRRGIENEEGRKENRQAEAKQFSESKHKFKEHHQNDENQDDICVVLLTIRMGLFVLTIRMGLFVLTIRMGLFVCVNNQDGVVCVIRMGLCCEQSGWGCLCVLTIRIDWPHIAMVSISNCFQPWPAPTQSWKCYGPHGKAGTMQPSFIHFTDVSLRVLL